MKPSPFTIGITGASGSGKTYFLYSLLNHFSSEEVCLVSQDNYYKPIEHQVADENGFINFDKPDSIDIERYVEDIHQLKNGNTIQLKEYTFNNPTKEPKIITILSCPVIIVEGIFIFHHKQLKELFDLKIFIDVEDHIRLKRRIIRDSEERGYDLNDVLYRYENHVFPSYKSYVEPHKFEADIIIPNNNHFERGLKVLEAYIRQKLNEQFVSN